MKPITSFALLSALATLASQGAVTDPVGYTTLDLVSGFNFAGLTLHESVVVSGDIESYGSGTATDTDVDFDTLLTAGVTYILEVETATGISETVASWSGDTLNTATDLSGSLAGGESYSLRPAATLATVFGADGSGLRQGGGGTTGADQVWIFNGTGYDKYYYDTFSPDSFGPSWRQTAPTSGDIDPTTVTMPYQVGFLIVAPSAGSVTITGEVKVGPTESSLVSGFNFTSSVAPVGATLATAFGADGASLRQGGGGTTGADQVWVFNGTGYDKYYYDTFSPDSFGPSWRQTAPTSGDIDPTTVDLPSGYLLVAPSAADVTQGVPDTWNL